jgi:UDP-N-acetylmuramoylalanine--D-glutamate ligase
MKHLVILGGGESGIGAALLALKHGYTVFLSDKGQIPPRFIQTLEANRIPYEQGRHTTDKILMADEIIKSPGIPDKVEIIQLAHAKEIPVISEIEFAARFVEQSTIIGITGSNGKTTTTHLTYHLLKTAGLKVAECGNVGTSFARLVAEGNYDYYVLELSSFQLDGIRHFRPQIAVLLNITPDHLDRYEYKMAHYVASKFRIVMNQIPSDLFIYNANDAEIKMFMNLARFQMQKIPIRVPLKKPILNGNKLTKVLHSSALEPKVAVPDFDMSACSLQGPHNYFNASCAIAVALKLGIQADVIQKGLENFINAPHRLENAGMIKGVSYINDSKATNVDSVFWALSAMPKSTILILGGLDKGNDYSQIEALVRKKVKGIICMGIDNQPIVNYFGKIVPFCVETRSMESAIAEATKRATKGDVVLLSPACASFDLFKNYEDRGEQFKAMVRQLAH